ncbi:MAG: branched-chain amino acid ABC transporter permease [Candidatus Caldarchaeum sp.]|nr:branched-chain amino acid ABC transporter permease [Candidatus Caldarchaeum sp.]
MALDFTAIEIASTLIRTLQSGMLYALMALGLTLTLAILRIPNVAHAEYVTVGAYVSFALINFANLTLWQVLVPSFIFGGLISFISYLLVFRPLKEKGSSMFILMVASFAVALIIRYVIYTMAAAGNWGLGVKPRVVTNVVFRVAGISFTDILLMAVPTALLSMIALYFFIMKTRTGKQMRALAENPELAVVSGIDPEKIAFVTMFLSGGLAGVAGSFWVVFTHAHPDIGLEALLPMIAASAIGGFYSFPATVVGALFVAFSENTIMDLLNRSIGLNLALKPLMPMAIIILVLLIRPSGLSGVSIRGRKPMTRVDG